MNQEKKEQIISMLKDGKSYDEIVSTVHISKSTISTIKKELKGELPSIPLKTRNTSYNSIYTPSVQYTKKTTKLLPTTKLSNNDIEIIKEAFVKATHQRSITRAEAKQMLDSIIKLATGEY